MKAHYRAFGGRLVIEIEGTTIKDLFAQIGPIAEVLDADNACGKCSSVNIYPRAREAQGFDFYELVCSDCGAKLSFGQLKVGGGLFPKRNDENGNPMDYRGWHIYRAIEAPKQEAPARPAIAPKPTAADPPELLSVIEKMKDARNAPEKNLVYAPFLAKLDEAIGSDGTDAAWSFALKQHGDPYAKAGADVAVLRYIWNRSKAGK